MLDTKVVNPDTLIPAVTAFILPQDITCADLEAQAQNGNFDAPTCSLLLTEVAKDCCAYALSTSPTSLPMITTAPSSVAIEEAIHGLVTIRLDQVPGELSSIVLDDYLASCHDFFRENARGLIVIRVELYNQTVVWTESRRRRLQTLQSVDTVLFLSGITAALGLDSRAFERSLPNIVNSNATGFIDSIQSQQDSDSASFFASVTDVIALQRNSTPDATPPPTSTKSTKLEAPVIIAIVFATALVICFLVGTLLCNKKMYTTKNLRFETSEAEVESQISSPNQSSSRPTATREAIATPLAQGANQSDPLASVVNPTHLPHFKDQVRSVAKPYTKMVKVDDDAEEIPVVSVRIVDSHIV
jgi:hypothetical protein